MGAVSSVFFVLEIRQEHCHITLEGEECGSVSTVTSLQNTPNVV
jgi:hypothetical protein